MIEGITIREVMDRVLGSPNSRTKNIIIRRRVKTTDMAKTFPFLLTTPSHQRKRNSDDHSLGDDVSG
jgi:hypothetical protein